MKTFLDIQKIKNSSLADLHDKQCYKNILQAEEKWYQLVICIHTEEQKALEMTTMVNTQDFSYLKENLFKR